MSSSGGGSSSSSGGGRSSSGGGSSGGDGSSSGNDRYFINDFPSDIGEDTNKIMNTERNALSKEYLDASQKNLVVLQKILEVGVAKGEGRDDVSVYTGLSGYTYLYLHLADTLKDTAYLEKASSLSRRALRHLRGRRVTFLCGDPGPLALAAVIHHREGNTAKVEECVQRITEMKEEVVSPTSGLPDEILYGRAGYLYALLYVRQKVGNTVVEDSLVRGVVTAMLESGRGMARRKRNRQPLQYEWHDKDYHGAAHGTAGILYMLMEAKEHLTSEELQGTVRPMIEYMSSLVYPSGNLPSSAGSDRDKLVQWCHGAPGAVYLFGKAYEVFGDDKFLSEAKRAGECVWVRGILKKGYGLCHGTAGNGYALLYLYQLTKDPKYLYQAGRFGLWCQDYGVHGCPTADRPLSLYEGLGGVLCFLLDLQHHPNNAHFPAFVVR